MSDDLDDLDDGLTDDAPTGRSPFAAPRFARLVGSPTTRRVSPRRLAGAVVLGLSLAWGGYEVVARSAGSITRWVAAQPDYQIPFGEIELDPLPPAYIRSGAAGILESVQHEAKYGTTLPILATNLDDLRQSLSRNPWVENAGPVRSSYRHLAIHVAYRQPVAVVVLDPPRKQVIVVDRNGVELPTRPYQFEWTETSPRYRAAGVPTPLVKIISVGTNVPDRTGLVWKSASPRVEDERVPQAARLAAFLAARAGTRTPGDRPTPDFTEIHYYRKKQATGFFLRDARDRWFFWESAPGSEAVTEPSAVEKWRQLGRFLDGPRADELRSGLFNFLWFSLRQAEPKDFGPE